MTLDRRLNAFRPDLADIALRGEVQAERFVEARPAVIAVPVADLHAAPSRDAGIDTQFLLGETVRVFDVAKGWAWVQGERDSYVGYMPGSSLSFELDPRPTHRVTALRSYVFPEPELKKPPLASLSMGSLVTVAGEEMRRNTRYAILPNGTAVPAVHVAPLAETDADFVAVAERFLHAPYLWGGTSGFGVDCSGLVQLAMSMAGQTVLRDTDMQERELGTRLAGIEGLQRGDLVFWKGHVGIMLDGQRLLHANAHHMMTAIEPLQAAVERLAARGAPVTSIRRLRAG